MAGTTPVNASEMADESSNPRNYLVLASFRDAGQAVLFVSQMTPQVDKPIKVTTLQADGRTIYRAMIGPFDKKLTRIQNQYSGFGRGGIWWLSANAGELMQFNSETSVMRVVVSEPAIVAEAVVTAEPVAVEPIVTKPVGVEPVAEESVVEEPAAEEPVVAIKEIRSPMTVAQHLEFCAVKANLATRKAQCSDDDIYEKMVKYVELLGVTEWQ
ncbi:MAG: hypothetical protein ABGY96_01575 [bacterium]|nr:hypothetical protein [Gammaproteobacteria bacterium]HIL95688.1 hypothetical protein [Pseudomonadales bacterium]